MDDAPVETLEVRLSAAGRGDETAFAEVYDAAASRVFGLVQRILRDAQQAEEVTHDVFLQVWETSNRYDPARGSALSWVLALAHRRAVEQLRSAEAAHPPTRAADGPRALETLSTSQRRALELAYFDGRSPAEIARLLDLPRRTTRTRIRDALIRVRDSTEPSRVSPRAR